MATNDLLYLPVSLGEAIDKLTILDIKLDKITDNRKLDVKKEYEILYEKLKDFIEKYKNLYNTMKKVNLLIWDMMDTLRDGDVDENLYLKVCKECIEYNDIRFRVKNKINYVSNSLLKEQKSYKINRLIIIINENLNNNETLSNIIKYFSFIYDEINIISDLNVDNLKKHFLYDNTILFKSNIENETFEYKSRVIIEDKECSEDELYKLFNITKNELYKLFNIN
jgi:hypothetical protein